MLTFLIEIPQRQYAALLRRLPFPALVGQMILRGSQCRQILRFSVRVGVPAASAEGIPNSTKSNAVSIAYTQSVFFFMSPLLVSSTFLWFLTDSLIFLPHFGNFFPIIAWL